MKVFPERDGNLFCLSLETTVNPRVRMKVFPERDGNRTSDMNCAVWGYPSPNEGLP